MSNFKIKKEKKKIGKADVNEILLLEGKLQTIKEENGAEAPIPEDKSVPISEFLQEEPPTTAASSAPISPISTHKQKLRGLKKLEMKIHKDRQVQKQKEVQLQKQESQEIYNVMYTKHLHQKTKIWNDGTLIYDLKLLKAFLYDQRERTDCTQVIDVKYLKIRPDFGEGERFQLNKFLVEIESRYVAAVERGSAGAAGAQSTKIEEAKTEKVEKEKSVRVSTDAAGNPKRNRKKFVAPIAKVEPDSLEKQHQLVRQEEERILSNNYGGLGHNHNRELEMRMAIFGQGNSGPGTTAPSENHMNIANRDLISRRRPEAAKLPTIADEDEEEEEDPDMYILKKLAERRKMQEELATAEKQRENGRHVLVQELQQPDARSKFTFGNGDESSQKIDFKKKSQESSNAAQQAAFSNPTQEKKVENVKDQFINNLQKQYSKEKQNKPEVAKIVRQKTIDVKEIFKDDFTENGSESEKSEINSQNSENLNKIEKQIKKSSSPEKIESEILKPILPKVQLLPHDPVAGTPIQPVQIQRPATNSILNQKLVLNLPSGKIGISNDEKNKTGADEDFMMDFLKVQTKAVEDQANPATKDDVAAIIAEGTAAPSRSKKPQPLENKGALFEMPKGSDDESEPEGSNNDKPSVEKKRSIPGTDPMENSKNKVQVHNKIQELLKQKEREGVRLNQFQDKDATTMIKNAGMTKGMISVKIAQDAQEKALLEKFMEVTEAKLKNEAEEREKTSKQLDLVQMMEQEGNPDEEEISEEMIKKIEKQQKLSEIKKRKLEEIEKERIENDFDETAYENYGRQKGKLKTGLENQIAKINQLDAMKADHKKKVADHNIKINHFDEICCDFSVRHDIYDMPREFVFRNRQCYSAYFMLAVIEMLKYAIKQDYESQKTDVKLIPIALDYIIPESKKKSKKPELPSVLNQNSKKKKKAADLKKKQLNQKYEDSSEESEEFEQGEEDGRILDSEIIDDQLGNYFIKFKEGIPGLVKRDMMVEDLWLLLKRPLVTNQSLAEVTDCLFVRSAWHFSPKQSKMKILFMGVPENIKYQYPEYKYAIKSTNLAGYKTLIENLIEFRELKNPYVDSILNIANSKSKFKIIKPCDPNMVEQARMEICSAFKLNIDQEIVLNEVTKWFIPKKEKKEKEVESSQSQKDNLIDGLTSQSDSEDEKKKDLKSSSQDFNNFQHHNTNIILVHGAFGCGKSYLLVSIIRFICHLLDQQDEKETKILVCALTNVAVDRILLMLKEQGFENFGRVGSIKKIHKQLIPFTYSSSNNKKAGDKEAIRHLTQLKLEIENKYPPNHLPPDIYEEWKSIMESIEQIKNDKITSRMAKLQSKRVIGATCASTSFEVMKNMQFKIVILDECSQMLEPQSLLPISKFNCRKLIAVGDPLQLPPIISFNFKEKRLQQQQILEASKNKGKTKRMQPHLPLFVRLQTEGQPSIILRTQYRCHPVIANVANYLFYEGTLRNGVDENSRKKLLKEFTPYTFISAERGEEKKKDFSFVNNYEAKFIMALLDFICQLIYKKITGQQIQYDSDPEAVSDNENELMEGLIDLPEDESIKPDYSIGVILTYKSQVELVKSLIEEMNNEAFKQIQVSTVDAFQGAERDIIILGCVRTKNLGFTEDCRRLNVAITRARRHLIVIGKETLLRRNNNWRYIIEKAKSEKEADKNYGYKRVEHFIKKGGNFKAMMKDAIS